MKRALATLLLTITGCVHTNFVPTTAPHAARPEDCEIQVFSAALPDRAFEELGIIEAEGSAWKADLEDVLPELRKRACLAGGDGIVLGTAQRYQDLDDEFDGDRLFTVATVIRWTEGG